jgi:hypothetical protein
LAAGGRESASANVSWSVHLWRRRPWRGLLGLAILAVTVVSVQAWGKTALLTGLAAVLLLAGVWPFYYPVRYRLDRDGVLIDYGLWRRMYRWERYAACTRVGDGLLLSPGAPFRWLASWRSLHLPCGERLAAVRELIPERLRWKPPARPEGGEDLS